MNPHVREELELREDDRSRIDRARIDAHLADCADCRTYAAELERNDALLSRPEPRVALPPLRASPRPGLSWAPRSNLRSRMVHRPRRASFCRTAYLARTPVLVHEDEVSQCSPRSSQRLSVRI